MSFAATCTTHRESILHLRPAVVGVAPLESVCGLDEVVLGHGVLELPHPNPSCFGEVEKDKIFASERDENPWRCQSHCRRTVFCSRLLCFFPHAKNVSDAKSVGQSRSDKVGRMQHMVFSKNKNLRFLEMCSILDTSTNQT